MSYTDFFHHIKANFPNIHVESGYEGWTMFFSNENLVGAYNEYTGEMDILTDKEVA